MCFLRFASETPLKRDSISGRGTTIAPRAARSSSWPPRRVSWVSSARGVVHSGRRDLVDRRRRAPRRTDDVADDGGERRRGVVRVQSATFLTASTLCASGAAVRLKAVVTPRATSVDERLACVVRLGRHLRREARHLVLDRRQRRLGGGARLRRRAVRGISSSVVEDLLRRDVAHLGRAQRVSAWDSYTIFVRVLLRWGHVSAVLVRLRVRRRDVGATSKSYRSSAAGFKVLALLRVKAEGARRVEIEREPAMCAALPDAGGARGRRRSRR